jgi:ppGpp synthetase/RelA/SpoT-type nucleotidyltranferase
MGMDRGMLGVERRMARIPHRAARGYKSFHLILAVDN